jgi:phosphohistidine phosphatase SixA
LYAASRRAIRATIERLHADASILLVVGHNPGISDFGAELASDLAHEQLSTAGFWRLPFDAGAWQQLTRRTAAGAASR